LSLFKAEFSAATLALCSFTRFSSR